MKALVITIIMVLSQSLMAKIADFNSLIQQQSKTQKEIYNSLNEDNIETIEISGTSADKNPQVYILGTNRESSSLSTLQSRARKVSVKSTLNQDPVAIEERQFVRLGEELNEAQ